MNQKELITKLLKASNEISKNRKSNANYIVLNKEYIQSLADERKISFNEMVSILENNFA